MISTDHRYGVFRPAVSPRWAAAASVAAGFGAVLLVGDEDGPVLCPFRLCTGGYCPACGSTRSFARFAGADPIGAFRTHPVAALLVVQVLVGLTFVLSRPQAAVDWLRPRLATLVWLNAGAAIVVWLLRMGLGQIPAPFGLGT